MCTTAGSILMDKGVIYGSPNDIMFSLKKQISVSLPRMFGLRNVGSSTP